MRSIIKTALHLLTASAVTALLVSCESPRIEFAEYEHDFGAVAPRASLSHVFIFRNTGEATLTITKVSPG